MAACVLREHHNVTIYERGNEHAIGGGKAISFSPGSFKILNEYGFDADRTGSVKWLGFKVYYRDGTLKKTFPINAVQSFGAEWLMALRADAGDEILRIATAESAGLGRKLDPHRVVYGVKAVDVDVDFGIVTLGMVRL